MSDSIKLRRLKQMRLANLEKEFLDDTLKGYDHYVFINERGKAQVITEQGRWVVEHIQTAVLKFNYQVDEINKKKSVKEFSEQELQAYEKKIYYLKNLFLNLLIRFGLFLTLLTTFSASSSTNLPRIEARKTS